MNLAQAVERCLKAQFAQNAAELTIKIRRSHLTRFVAWLEAGGCHELTDLSRDRIEDYIEELSWAPTARGRPASVVTRNGQLESIKSFCRWLASSDLVAVDPAKDVAYGRKPDLLPKNIPAPSDVEKILNAPDPRSIIGFRDRVVLELLYGTAIRLRELCGLDVDDMDLETKLVVIRHGKGDKGRMVPAGTLLCELLQSYLADVRPELLGRRKDNFNDPALILSQYGERLGPRGVAKIVDRRCREVGLKLTPHLFRHACATHMLRRGANVRHLQELLGHKKLDTTELYTRVTISELQEAHAKFHPRGSLSEPDVRKPRR